MGQRALSILFTHFGEHWIRGSERILLNLAAQLDRTRFTPVIWCNGGPLAGQMRALGLTVYESDFAAFFGYDAPPFALSRYLSFVKTGLELVQRHDARLIHCNGAAPHQWMFPVGFRAAIPVVAHVHADYLRRERFTTLLHQASHIVGVSQSVIAPFLHDGVPAARCRVIHNGIDFSALRPGRDHRLRDGLGISRGALVVAAVGSLIARKGFDLLIRAAARLPDLDLHLVIAGDGPERDRLPELAMQLGLKDRVHFAGYCSDISPVYAAADIAALPSRAEAFGLALVEASYFGLPVVSHQLPGVAEAVLDGETGLLTPVGDTSALAAAIRRLCESEAERKRLGEAGRRHALAQFSVARMVGQFEALYDELSGARFRRFLPLQPYWRLLPGLGARPAFKPAPRPEAAA